MALLPLLFVGACSANPMTLPPPATASVGPATSASSSVEAPAEVYSRIARGALRCWFGPEGSLKKTHVFHAKVDPPSEGGAAEIGVHTRETGSNHGVLRALTVTIARSGDGSLVETRNARFAEPQANQMIADVSRWIEGKDDCSIVGTGGWSATKPPPAPSKSEATAKPTKAPPPR